MQDQPPALNPYAPPQAEINRESRDPGGHETLALPSKRFNAKVLDQTLVVGIFLLGALLQFFLPDGNNVGAAGFFIGAIVAGGICIYQWYLIVTTGRSLGKRWCRIKILRVNGQPVDFVSGVLMRSWLPFLIGLVPGLGSIFSLVDACFIFNPDRRCLHDRMAGTKVVDAR